MRRKKLNLNAILLLLVAFLFSPVIYAQEEKDDLPTPLDSVFLKDTDYYTAVVSAKVLNFREGPGTQSKIIRKLTQGELLFLTSEDEGEAYRKVLYIKENIYGYVYAKYLKGFKKVAVNKKGSLQIFSFDKALNVANLSLRNDAHKMVQVSFGDKTFTIKPRDTKKLEGIPPGTYRIVATSPGLIPYVGIETVKAGYTYSWFFYIRTIFNF